MNEQLFSIDPITKIKTIVYTQFKMEILNMNFNNSVTIQVQVLDDVKEYSKTFIYDLTSDEYESWKSDEDLLLIIKNKIRYENF